MNRRIIAFLLLTCVLLAGATPSSSAAPRQTQSAKGTTQQWIMTSDVHFDPLANARLAERLAAAPPERWRGVFASAGEAVPYASYGSDTNYPLLESSLDAMKNAAPQPAVVIIAGDFLAHDFRDRFNREVKDHSDAAYAAFVDKTISFIADEFRAAFPGARLVPVIGNNDSYCGDYASTPRSPFLVHFAQAFASNVSSDGPAFVAQFSTGGYYSVALPAGNAHAIVLNDVFWSQRYANTCGDRASNPGDDELTWLRATLTSTAGPLWVIAHIPPGVDAYMTLHASNRDVQDVTLMLRDQAQSAIVDALSGASPHIAMTIAGHVHMNAFRVIRPSATASAVPMLLIPSITPDFANNPSFAVGDVDATTAQLLDEHLYVLEDLASMAKDGRRLARWKREYSFDEAYGEHAITAPSLERLQQKLFGDSTLQHRFETYYDAMSGRASIGEATWRAYWCANVAMSATDYRACAMPQIQRQLPPQPSAPPKPTPSPSPAPTPTPTHEPSFDKLRMTGW